MGIEIKFDKFWDAARQMIETAISRLPSLILAAIVFLLFYILSIFVSRIIRRSTRGHRENLGVVFARLLGAATILLGALVATSIIAPSFQATDLIKVFGIGGVAIGFAFQNILQNFLAGLLLLWAEPFRVGDEIKIDPYEGTVEEIQTRATIIKTYDGRQVVIPNADLFTHSVIVNTAHETRRWEYDFALSNVNELNKLKARIVSAVRNAPETLPDPAPEALIVAAADQGSAALRIRVLWWTKRPRHHEMLASYDRVLTAIWESLPQQSSSAKTGP